MCEQWMLLNNTVVRVRLEALCTQLVFDHSLRVRVKAELSEKKRSVAAGNGSDTGRFFFFCFHVRVSYTKPQFQRRANTKEQHII